MKRYISVIIILLAACSLNAQPVDTARFRLEYTPRLMSFSKLNQQPDMTDSTTEKVKFDYYIMPQRMDATFKPGTIPYSKVSPDALEKMYRNFIKVGFGYPLTPLAELSFHNLQNTKYSLGANVHHYSYWAPQIGKEMKQYPNGPMSDTRVHLNFKKFFRNQTLYTAADYNHEYANYYGHSDSLWREAHNGNPYAGKEDLGTHFHHAKALVGIASNYTIEDKKLKQDVRVNYDFIRTKWKDMENHAGLNSFFAYDSRWAKISGSQCYRLDLDLDYFNDKWSEAKGMNTVLFVPEATAHFTIKEYHIIAGIGGVVDYNNNVTKGTVYPIAELQLGIVPSILNIYAGVNGNAHFNSLKDMLYENPFLKPQIDSLRTTINYINIYGGIKGNLVKNLNYNLAVHYSYARNLAFYRIDTTEYARNQFEVEYHNGNVLNLCLNINYEVIKNLRFNFEANYWLYALTKTNAAPYHKPELEFSFNGQYILKDRFIFDLNFDLAFRSKTLAYDEFFGRYTVQNMKPILDFGIGFEYLINDHFAAFANINNIAHQHYARFYDYKAFGINAMVGVTYAFGHESLKAPKKAKKQQL